MSNSQLVIVSRNFEMDDVSPEEYLTNFRAGFDSGAVPEWFAMEILLRKMAEWNPQLVLEHSHPQVVESLRELAIAIARGDNDESIASWQDADEEVQTGLRKLIEHLGGP